MQCCLPRDIWQHQELILVVTIVWGNGAGVATGIKWADIRNTAKHPTMHKETSGPKQQYNAYWSLETVVHCEPSVVFDSNGNGGTKWHL